MKLSDTYPDSSHNIMEISSEIKITLLKLVRYTIADKLNIDIKKDELNFMNEIYSNNLGAFVTIHKNGNLRGCIGNIIGYRPLIETIRDMAVSAAFKDPRFVPLTEDEFTDIDIEISVLSEITKVDNIDEIVPGRDGLIISHEGRKGLLLPQVATEYNWTKEEFLSHTCMKAGLKPNSWSNEPVNIEKFTANVFSEKEFNI